jgi:dTMP kinase
MSSPRGRFVALEGIDGAGKSTLLRALGRSLRRQGWAVRLRHEPVDRTLGRLAQEAGARDAWSGAVYFTVDRHLAAPRLRADLRRYDLVLSDRSLYSTLAYQGSRLPPKERARLEQLQRRATVVPDRVILLDLPPVWIARRLAVRAATRGPLERRAALGRVARAYRGLARRDAWVVLDARLPRGVLLRRAKESVDSLVRRSGTGRRGKRIRAPRGRGRDR